MEKIIIRTSNGAMGHIEKEINDLLEQGWRTKNVSIAANQSGTYGANIVTIFVLCKEEEEKKKTLGFRDNV